MIWLLELLGMPELLCLQGYGGYSGYHGYSAKNSTEGQIIWLLELLGVSYPWGYRVTQVIVVIVVIMVIMQETKIHLWPYHIVIRVLGYASSPVSTGHSGYVVILIILQKKIH